MTFDFAKDVVLFALAIYGAGLSTWNLAAAIRKDRRLVRVTVGSKIPVGIGGVYEGKVYAHIEATNIGHRPVTITAIGFKLRDGSRLYSLYRSVLPGLEDTALPATLTDGQTARMHQAYSEIAEALVKDLGKPGRYHIFPFCEDSTGKVYLGKRWIVDPTEFSRM